jgi:phosphate transport system permease protein
MSVLFGIVLLFLILKEVWDQGASSISHRFFTEPPSRFPEKAGVQSALWGSVWIVGLVALISLPVGVAAAVYLEEYSRKGRLSTFIELNISNLAGVPSIVFGILGMVVFVRVLALGQSVLAGAMTMSLLVLPTVIIAAREAIRAVPSSMRHAALALGATKWQTVASHVLPTALPGILTGVILSLSRAIGETAPLLMVGAAGYIAFPPSGPLSSFTVLPIQIFFWADLPNPGYRGPAAAAILVLLAVLLTMNAAAVIIRQRFQRYKP